jgi:hypothetical protein
VSHHIYLPPADGATIYAIGEERFGQRAFSKTIQFLLAFYLSHREGGRPPEPRDR